MYILMIDEHLYTGANAILSDLKNKKKIAIFYIKDMENDVIN